MRDFDPEDFAAKAPESPWPLSGGLGSSLGRFLK